MVKNRVEFARSILAEVGVDAVVFFEPVNLRFLCGFTGTEGILVLTHQDAVFLTDSRYTAQARQQVIADEVIEFKSKYEELSLLGVLSDAVRVGFEADSVTFAVYQKLRDHLPKFDWVPLGKELSTLRGFKDAEEIEILCEATRISSEAFEQILPLVKAGVTEREIALELEIALRRLGGDGKSFEFIVASGDRGALPHGVASDRVLQENELVTVDFGTRFRGYCSDETVTLAVGNVSSRLRQIYDTVLEAHDRAIEMVRPGVPLRDLDRVARDIIRDRGFGEYFGHGLGHGVGMAVHEFPAVSSKSECAATAGMVITIEPGIYIPGVGGVRIEDMVLVTETGYRILTKIPKEFRILPS